MKYAIVVFVGLILTLGGCTASQQGEKAGGQPELVKMTSLPPLTSAYAYIGLKLNVLFQIRADGSVADVKMVGTTDNADWSLAAIDSMKRWQFSVTTPGRSHEDQWLRSTVIVQVQELRLLTLGEIRTETEREADSLYELLGNGSDFETLARQIRPGKTSPVGRFLGSVEISSFPQHVRNELQKISVNSYTRPIRLGSNYVIYKRFKPDGPREFD